MNMDPRALVATPWNADMDPRALVANRGMLQLCVTMAAPCVVFWFYNGAVVVREGEVQVVQAQSGHARPPLWRVTREGDKHEPR